MTEDIGCPYPQCDAGRMLEEIKDSNKEYRGDIQRQLAKIDDAIRAMTKAIAEFVTSNKLVEQSIVFLREGESRNEAAHIKLFQRIEAIEGKTTMWLWELLKMLLVAGLGFAAGMLK